MNLGEFYLGTQASHHRPWLGSPTNLWLSASRVDEDINGLIALTGMILSDLDRQPH